jgi:hypothetical protein
MLEFQKFLESPYTALSAALILGGLALSGKFNVTATQCLLITAWAVSIVGLRGQPLPVMVGISAAIAGGLILLAYWFRPDVVPLYAGILTPKSTLLFSARNGGTIPKIEIGRSGVILAGDGGTLGAQLFPALRASDFKVESVGGKIKVSTRIVDGSGNLIAEIIRNEWKVSPTQAWDRNYSDDALEVKDSRGLVILQVRALPDRIQVQGGWWINMGPPNGTRRLWVWKDPTKDGAQFVINPKDDANPIVIPPIFEYPGDQHLGELMPK